jgi:hypothetical protein
MSIKYFHVQAYMYEETGRSSWRPPNMEMTSRHTVGPHPAPHRYVRTFMGVQSHRPYCTVVQFTIRFMPLSIVHRPAFRSRLSSGYFWKFTLLPGSREAPPKDSGEINPDFVLCFASNYSTCYSYVFWLRVLMMIEIGITSIV